MKNDKVYILSKKSYHNYKNAEKFGELKEIFSGDLPVFQSDKLIQMIQEELMVFEKNDLLLLSGNPLVNVIAVFYLISKFGELKVLLFNVFNDFYILRTLRKGDLEYEKINNKTP